VLESDGNHDSMDDERRALVRWHGGGGAGAGEEQGKDKDKEEAAEDSEVEEEAHNGPPSKSQKRDPCSDIKEFN
jgi:hypothetical protein